MFKYSEIKTQFESVNFSNCLVISLLFGFNKDRHDSWASYFSNSRTDSYYKPFRTTLNDIAPIIIGLSAATTLLAAPLASLNYKTGDFNMKRYFTIAGSGLIGVSIGVPLYLLSKPKTYKLNTGEWHFE